jgi:hypothetical protein
MWIYQHGVNDRIQSNANNCSIAPVWANASLVDILWYHQRYCIDRRTRFFAKNKDWSGLDRERFNLASHG